MWSTLLEIENIYSPCDGGIEAVREFSSYCRKQGKYLDAELRGFSKSDGLNN